MNQALPKSGESAEPPGGSLASSGPTPKTARRALSCWLIAVAVGIVLVRLAGIQGWFKPVHIAGDSMAPNLLGEHQRLACPECAWPLRVSSADQAGASDEVVVCPNCGSLRMDRAGAVDQPGERVWIDHFAHALRSIRRGELVALRDPLDPRRLAIKRVIGLPGEQIRLDGGDVFVNSRRWQKSLDELRDVAVLVHDDRFRPTGRERPLPERWRDEAGWSVYHHWRCFASPLPRTDESPVLDNDAFNQQLSRPLHDVTDLMLTGRMTLGRGEQVIVRLTSPAGLLVVILDAAAGQIELRRGTSIEDRPQASRAGTLVESAPLPSFVVDREVCCEVAVCDRRILVACDRRPCFVRDEGADGALFQVAGSTPWAVACVGEQSRFVDRRILRDLYYPGPDDSQPSWVADRSLRGDEYILLGDNSPVSVDSRHWPNSGAIPASQIVGRVLRGWRSR